MKKLTSLAAVMAFLGLFSGMAAADHKGEEGAHSHHHHQNVMAHDAFVRATPPGAKNSAAYFTLVNKMDKDVMVTSATTDVSNVSELHTHTMIDGAMSMRQVKTIHVPANKKVMFQPGGLHVMLFELKKPLVVGEKVHLTLNLNNGKSIQFMADIISPTDIKPHHMKKKGMKEGHEMSHSEDAHSHH